MNDLTKDELEYMIVCIEGEIKYYGADHVGHGAIKKIQHLIDNYCEHDYDYSCRYCSECKKCGVIVDGDT